MGRCTFPEKVFCIQAYGVPIRRQTGGVGQAVLTMLLGFV